ncbi:MAG: hypothetical protein ACI4SM_03405 [Candidatus Gastranaerophilaceae bacterium]
MSGIQRGDNLRNYFLDEGDIVRVKEVSDYESRLYLVSDEMKKYTNKLVTIDYMTCDGFCKIKEDNGYSSWSRHIFELIIKKKIKKVFIL